MDFATVSDGRPYMDLGADKIRLVREAGAISLGGDLRIADQEYALAYKDEVMIKLGQCSPPGGRPNTDKGRIVAIPKVGGLHHRYELRAA